MTPTSSNQVTLGLDVGGTRIKAVAMQLPNQVLHSYEGPSDAHIDTNAVRRAIHKTVNEFTKLGIKPASIGLGCAGSVDTKNGVVRNSPNFSGWTNVPLRSWLEQDFGVAATIENDANCAVFTEFKLGNARGACNAILLTLGTGIGGGLIINGRLFRGSTGAAGEIGHLSIYANGKPCPCGNSGCFERYCSASALRETIGGTHSAREIFANGQEEPFKGVIQTFLRDFRVALVSLANTFDPDCILLGGAVSKGVSLYFDELKSWMSEHAFPSVSKHVRLDLAKHENLSGAMGAALLSQECQ